MHPIVAGINSKDPSLMLFRSTSCEAPNEPSSSFIPFLHPTPLFPSLNLSSPPCSVALLFSLLDSYYSFHLLLSYPVFSFLTFYVLECTYFVFIIILLAYFFHLSFIHSNVCVLFVINSSNLPISDT